MGVYVSEINMPKGEGSKLVLQIFPNGEVYDGHGFRLGIANWAEAVPVPPHGRLVDADALDEIIQEEISKDYNKEHRPKVTWSRAFELFEDVVLDAPTIIPAEEGE